MNLFICTFRHAHVDVHIEGGKGVGERELAGWIEAWKVTCNVGLKLNRNTERTIVNSIAIDVEYT